MHEKHETVVRRSCNVYACGRAGRLSGIHYVIDSEICIEGNLCSVGMENAPIDGGEQSREYV